MSNTSDYFKQALSLSGHLANKYTDLKRHLALSHPTDTIKYDQIESEFIRNVEGLQSLAWWSLSEDAVESEEMGYLVTLGGKTGTCSLLKGFTDANLALPTPGTISVLTDSKKNPISKIEITKVDVCKYGEIDLAFAKTCAIGNRTMEAWCTEHFNKFSRYEEITDATELVCVNFRVVENLEWAYFNPMPNDKFKARSALDVKIER